MLVFERSADLSCYEPIVRKVSRVLKSCEVSIETLYPMDLRLISGLGRIQFSLIEPDISSSSCYSGAALRGLELILGDLHTYRSGQFDRAQDIRFLP